MSLSILRGKFRKNGTFQNGRRRIQTKIKIFTVGLCWQINSNFLLILV